MKTSFIRLRTSNTKQKNIVTSFCCKISCEENSLSIAVCSFHKWQLGFRLLRLWDIQTLSRWARTIYLLENARKCYKMLENVRKAKNDIQTLSQWARTIYLPPKIPDTECNDIKSGCCQMMVKSLPFALCETDYSCSEKFCNPIFHGAFLWFKTHKCK